MKKTLIAGAGVAAFGLAALPFAGVFATGNHLIDNITVNVPAACSITNDNTDEDAAQADLTNNYYKTVYNGQYAVIGASDTTGSPAADNTVGITCNSTATSGSATSWKLTAVGTGATGHETDLYDSSIDDEIPSGQTPITSATAGNAQANSDWSMRVVIATPATAATGYTSNTFIQIPDTAKDIARGNGTAAEGSLTMDYGVYVSGTQAAGTYTGQVTYTLVNPEA